MVAATNTSMVTTVQFSKLCGVLQVHQKKPKDKPIYYKLMYGNNEDIVLKTIWEPSSTKEAEMLINSARNAVHFAYRHNGYAIRSYYIPIQCRTSENDKERQRDDRDDRNRHGRSGYRDSDPSGGRQHPGNGDQPDDGDDTQSSPESAYDQWYRYMVEYYPNHLLDQNPTAQYATAQYATAQY
ncbi:hypothetical protein J4E86_003824 [Alternaria arbusti]|uniref:uncharacterized protein n=1 Tax=Alternaria arbusti TaxID=232088 RepID=UPI00221FB9E3|nr:uncharacterized protein J4E86_003824 [Alternaria arbusti]KAI4958226.1 hypothetical protein J4E86_003824 [Alternaria arbusti]